MRITIRPALLALALVLPLPVAAQGVFVEPNITLDRGPAHVPLTGAMRSIHNELKRYGYGDVDPRRLRATQIAQIRYYVSRDLPQGEIRNRLGAVIGGSFVQRVFRRVVE